MGLKSRKERTSKRHNRARKKIRGSAERPRLSVYRSSKHICAQIIDDDKHSTLCAFTSYSKEAIGKVKGSDKAGAEFVGKNIGEQAIAAGIKTVVFDGGGNQHHGRVKALADAAREAGLEF